MLKLRSPTTLVCLILAACGSAALLPQSRLADVLITNGVIYDGSGGAPVPGGVAIRGERVVALGDISGWSGAREVDAQGLAIAPGFVNMLSWANESLIQDGRSLSDLKQGVTLEVMGEGWSMGPLDERLKKLQREQQVDIHYDITWTTLGEYLDQLVARGISTNVASMVGAATLRQYVIGDDNLAPTPPQLQQMQELVRQAMREGALGVGSALIYNPGVYARTDELIALVAAAKEFGGGYVSHLRSEGDRFLEALDELIGIARATGAHAEVYHLKAAGQANWPKMKQAIERIEAARKAGLDVSANMYCYTAGATGLDAAMPSWVQEGGLERWIERLKDQKIRRRVVQEMRKPGKDWENLLLAAGSPERVLFMSFKNQKLKPLTGKTLAEVARLRHEAPEDAAIDLVIEDHSRVGVAYFLMSEDNVRLGLAQPWVALGSDEGSYAPEGVFLLSLPHPRAYGNVARFLGHYVREERATTLADAIRRLTKWPAQNWKLKDRGCIDAGCYADVVIFDPASVADRATYQDPQQFATGVRDVFVNGVQVLRNGEHTGAKPGQVVHGPGYRKA